MVTKSTGLSTLADLSSTDAFSHRHIGPDQQQQQAMLDALKVNSLEQLITQTVPDNIRTTDALTLGAGQTEPQALATLQALAERNTVNKSYIGMGYYNTHVPNVILRNVLENPAWYTAYTPYQSEISQGRLAALLNFQQMVMDLTGMAVANASLLDEATAAAEAMMVCRRASRSNSPRFFVAEDVHPQTLEVMTTRAQYLGIELIVGNPATDLAHHDVFGVQLQYPNTYGVIVDLIDIIAQAKEQQALVCVATDLLALVLLQPPGALGADIALGSSQRFGVPMGFGGPHAAFFATRTELKRLVPGRIIGVSRDSRGQPALRMAMQTREQHIRRDKATSNICTAQALLANMAGFYGVYYGPQGLRTIAERVHRLAAILALGLTDKGMACNSSYFDTLTVTVGKQQHRVYQRALAQGCNLRRIGDDRLGISVDEATTADDVAMLWTILLGEHHGLTVADLDTRITQGELTGITATQRRQDAILSHPVFNRYHSETEMLRYLKRLENKDYSLVHGMIPLGSCTMKLNATAEMLPVTWPAFAAIHPYAPREQVTGYLELIKQLEAALLAITGYDALSLQPNAGSQGELAGLLAIRRYQAAIGEGHRHICLIPTSAHGTNPASAVMAGMHVVLVACDNNGNVDATDLRQKAAQYRHDLSALMITYPSTHGVYEEAITSLCAIIHEHGGQVYLDGANMNAMVGLVKPGAIGADVSHLNLHKTFAIPHGGGGPGMGPIGVKQHLAPFLPGHAFNPLAKAQQADTGAVAAAPFGSGAILPISWLYLTLLGSRGLKQATEVAILNANYLVSQLADHYPILYRGRHGRVAHECIIDVRPIKAATGITEEDVAKRLMDYSFHAPTMSFPVAGTLMIEPTESESKAELDRLITALISIREEIGRVETGHWSADNNPLKHAPHTQADLADADWQRPYSRLEAAFPAGVDPQAKFWPATNRVDNVYGDRYFNCSCLPVEYYGE